MLNVEELFHNHARGTHEKLADFAALRDKSVTYGFHTDHISAHLYDGSNPSRIAQVLVELEPSRVSIETDPDTGHSKLRKFASDKNARRFLSKLIAAHASHPAEERPGKKGRVWQTHYAIA